MTLEEFFDLSPEQMQKMTDAELEEFWKPYFPTTRPELAAIQRASAGVARKKAKGGGGMAEALALEFLAKCGVKLSK